MQTRGEGEAKVPNVTTSAVVAMFMLWLPSCNTLKDCPETEQIGDDGATAQQAPGAVSADDPGCEKTLSAPPSANRSNRQPGSEPGSVPYGIVIGH